MGSAAKVQERERKREDRQVKGREREEKWRDRRRGWKTLGAVEGARAGGQSIGRSGRRGDGLLRHVRVVSMGRAWNGRKSHGGRTAESARGATPAVSRRVEVSVNGTVLRVPPLKGSCGARFGRTGLPPGHSQRRATGDDNTPSGGLRSLMLQPARWGKSSLRLTLESSHGITRASVPLVSLCLSQVQTHFSSGERDSL